MAWAIGTRVGHGPRKLGRDMKPRRCSICGKDAAITFTEGKGGALYGVACEEGHSMRNVFGTRNRAIQAWDECQRFVEAYTEEQ